MRLATLAAQRLSQDRLKAFRTALVDLGGLRQVPEERRRRLTYRNGRLAGIVDVVVHLRMPQTRAFGVALPRPGDAATDYDEARHFIVGQKTQASLEPAPGQFYPEVMGHAKGRPADHAGQGACRLCANRYEDAEFSTRFARG